MRGAEAEGVEYRRTRRIPADGQVVLLSGRAIRRSGRIVVVWVLLSRGRAGASSLKLKWSWSRSLRQASGVGAHFRLKQGQMPSLHNGISNFRLLTCKPILAQTALQFTFNSVFTITSQILSPTLQNAFSLPRPRFHMENHMHAPLCVARWSVTPAPAPPRFTPIKRPASLKEP
jgi:hypothetical protein